MSVNFAFAEAMTALRLIVEWDYEQATEEELQDIIGVCSEVVNRAQAERYGRRQEKTK